MNQDFEKALSAIFSTIGEREDSELQVAVSNTLEYAKKNNIDITDPEDFDLFVVQRVNRVLSLLAKNLHKKSLVDKNYAANFVFKKYDFLSSHIEELCELREGSACRADKSRYILFMYLEYSINGELPEFDPEARDYWIPKFGDYQMWMDYCDSLYELYNGRPENYIKCYKKLLDEEKRTYKYLFRNWYIKFKNGEILNIGHTWNDNLEVPLEKLEEKEVYLLHVKKSPKNQDLKIHEAPEDDFLVYNKYLEVPFEIIDDIYYETEEKYL